MLGPDLVLTLIALEACARELTTSSPSLSPRFFFPPLLSLYGVVRSRGGTIPEESRFTFPVFGESCPSSDRLLARGRMERRSFILPRKWEQIGIIPAPAPPTRVFFGPYLVSVGKAQFKFPGLAKPGSPFRN